MGVRGSRRKILFNGQFWNVFYTFLFGRIYFKDSIKFSSIANLSGIFIRGRLKRIRKYLDHVRRSRQKWEKYKGIRR